MNRIKVNGVLLLFHHPLTKNAPTIMEHVDALCRHSQYNVWKVNTELGFPKRLSELQFHTIVLHYSLFGYRPILSREFLEYLKGNRESYKIAFFQDEHRFCKMRFNFINHYNLDCVFTLVEPSSFGETYWKYTNVPRLAYCLPGYVSEEMLAAAGKYSLDDGERGIDIGYRGRKLEYYMGIGAQEKYEIGIEFKEKASRLGLKLDIEVEESKRIYGSEWYRFVANCRGVLGVEAGVSIFDLEDFIYEGYQKVMAENPKMSFDEMSKRLNFKDRENRIYYRTISARHFEAAAFRVCQILFEGKYSGILEPMVHYIPLKKDFSNFNDVIELFMDPTSRNKLTENAYNDLIASRRYTYESFLQNSFDPVLLEAGLEPKIESVVAEDVTKLLDEDAPYRQIFGRLKSVRHRQFPGRSSLVSILRPLKQKYNSWKEGKTAELIK